MDGLSAASGAFAVISLAIQLGAGVQKLCEFWNSIQDGPSEIRRIVRHLNIISNILDDIRQDANKYESHQKASDASLLALDACSDSIEDLQKLVDELKPRRSDKLTSRKWAAFKTAWRQDSIRKFLETLHDMKLTLVLARQNVNEHIVRTRYDVQQQKLSLISDDLAILLQQKTSGAVTTISEEPDTPDKHLTTLLSECQKISNSIANPVARLGVQHLMGFALSQISHDLHSKNQIDGSLNSPTDSLCIKAGTVIEVSSNPPLGSFQLVQLSSPKRQPYAVERSYFHISTIFGTVQVLLKKSRVYQSDEQKVREPTVIKGKDMIQTILTIHPSQWLLAYGVSFGVQLAHLKSFRGLDCNISTFRAVPNDAPIFDICAQGSVSALQKLFDEGKASPWDRDSWGFTPLFIAARHRNLELCRFLLSQGADLNATNNAGHPIASWAFLGPPSDIVPKSCNLTEEISVLRLFISQLEFEDDDNCSGMLALNHLCASSASKHQSCSHPAESASTLQWALSQLAPEISPTIPAIARGIASLLARSIREDDINSVSQIMKFCPDINSKGFLPWYSLSRKIDIGMCKHNGRETICYPGRLSDNILHDTLDTTASGFGETPISFALQSSHSFFLLRKFLQETQVEIRLFIEKEISKPPLVKKGWSIETLLALFDAEYTPLELPSMKCEVCEWEDVFARETSWEKSLELVKAGNYCSEEIEKLLGEGRDQRLVGEDFVSRVCYYCALELEREEMGEKEGGNETEDVDDDEEEEEEEEDPMFLLSF